jgi:hypothetical protein
MLKNLLEGLEKNKHGIVLVEYPSLGHPELVFADLLSIWLEMGVKPVIVDIGNTLHVFLQHLRFEGVEIEVDDVPVIKELGKARVGNVVGEISEVKDFEYHMAKYSRMIARIPEESRGHTMVLGLEKFVFPFMENQKKIERYLEVVHRGHLKSEEEIKIVFLNVSMASDYFTKSLEQDCEYVLRIENGILKQVKAPGGDLFEVL